MVAYMFEARHHDAILEGSKVLTFRASQKKRHAQVGEEIQFLPGRARPKFAIGECVYRATVLFNEHGVAEIRDVALSEAGQPIDYILQACRRGAPQARNGRARLAAADGFTSWEDLVRWHAEQGGPAENGLIVREVIGWTAATAVALRAPEL